MNRSDPTTGLSGTATGSDGKVGGSPMGRLGRLTQHKNKAGDITSALAWDDLTGMKLDAGKVIEARTKEEIKGYMTRYRGIKL